jgi:hypothetical protein
MAIHWFAWLLWGLGIVCLIVGLFFEESELRVIFGVAGFLLLFAGLGATGQANNQNEGLASRNTQYFKVQGYKVLSAYGHEVCVAAGQHKLCLQERKDATGMKQLVMPLSNGRWAVLSGPGGGFMDAVSHAPQD